jgi:hypothetical protein
MRHEADFDEFSAMLDSVCSLLSRGAYVPSAANTVLFFRSLARYELAAVRRAFDGHVRDPQRGRFAPVPADIVAQLEQLAADDGRPGADEAWAIALVADDEARTVVWTGEMAQAWHIARNVLTLGDEVGARIAFRDAYNRLVEGARRQRQPAKWEASLGFDAAERGAVVSQAVEQGRLPPPRANDAHLQIEAPKATIATLAAGAPPEVKAALLQLRERITTRTDDPGADALAKAETAQRKAQTAELVAQHQETAQ